MLSVIMLSVIMLGVVMLGVVMLSVVMLSVVAPRVKHLMVLCLKGKITELTIDQHSSLLYGKINDKGMF